MTTTKPSLAEKQKTQVKPLRDTKIQQAPTYEVPAYEIIELLFFAYRDFVSDADKILADYAFGRAHHRILHFVDRSPGLTIAALLDILRITKQSLNRVLKELIDKGFVKISIGEHDRRQRLLFTTKKGHSLALKLALSQTARINQAISENPEAAKAFLKAMIHD